MKSNAHFELGFCRCCTFAFRPAIQTYMLPSGKPHCTPHTPPPLREKGTWLRARCAPLEHLILALSSILGASLCCPLCSANLSRLMVGWGDRFS